MDQISNQILSEHFPGIAIVVDAEGKVITFNNEAHRTLQRIKKGDVIFDIMDQDAGENLNKLFIEAKSYERLIKDTLTLKFGALDKDYQIIISTISSEAFLITATQTNLSSPKKELTRFSVVTKKIEDIVQDKRILDIIEIVKTSFPFTFISKNNLQRNIDSYNDLFWIKDRDGKYLIVNKLYSEFIGVKPLQLEGKNENDFLPKYIADLNSYINTYIKETANTIVFNGLYTVYNLEKDKTTEVIQFPICDIDNCVVAIIGFVQTVSPPSIIKSKNETFLENSVFSIPDAMLLFDLDLKAITSNEIFNEIFNLDKNLKIDGIKIDSIFDIDVFSEIERFISSHEEKIVFKKKIDDYFIVYNIKKINDDNNNLLGYGVYCQKEHQQEKIIIDKVKMYEEILEASPDAIYIYDVENLKFLEVNNAALKLYGYSRTQFLQMDLTDLYAPEDIQTILQTNQINNVEKKFVGTWKQRKKDGSSLLVEISKSTFLYKDRKAQINIIRDVTPSLSEKNDLQIYKAMFDNSNELIIQTDKDGFIKYSNNNAINELGYTRNELLEKTFIALLSDKDRGRINSSVYQKNLNQVEKFEIELKKNDLEVLTATLTVTPILNFDKLVDSYLLIISLIKIKETIKETIKEKIVEIEVEKLNYDIDKNENTDGKSCVADPNFLSHVFHELLTPINVIIGFGQEISESIANPNDDQKEAANIIKENQKVLMRIMDTVGEYVSIESNQGEFILEDILITDIIEDIIKEAQNSTRDKEVEITYGKISSSLKFSSNKYKIKLLLIEFVKYAAFFTNNKKIFISSNQFDDDSIIFSIKDDKSNISDELKNCLVELLTQDDTYIRKKYGISRFSFRLFKKLMEILNCSYEKIYKDNKTSELGILIPYKFIKQPKIITEQSNQPKVEEIIENDSLNIKKENNIIDESSYDNYIDKQQEIIQELKNDSEIKINENYSEQELEDLLPVYPNAPIVNKIDNVFNFSNYSCLYVEDQIDSQILFKIQMKDLKFVDFATSLEKALPLINSKSYDFIVMDMNLQGEYNGLDALRIIRKIPGYQTIPIVAATAYVLPGDKDKFIAAGFSDFLSKPIMRDKLIESIKKIKTGYINKY